MTHFPTYGFGYRWNATNIGHSMKWKGSYDDNFIFQCDHIETGRL